MHHVARHRRRERCMMCDRKYRCMRAELCRPKVQALNERRQVRLPHFNDARIEHIVFGSGATILRCALERKTELAA